MTRRRKERNGTSFSSKSFDIKRTGDRRETEGSGAPSGHPCFLIMKRQTKIKEGEEDRRKVERKRR